MLFNDYGNMSIEMQDACMAAAKLWLKEIGVLANLDELSITDAKCLLSQAHEYIYGYTAEYILMRQHKQLKEARR